MQSRSIPSVTLYIRITDEKGNRRYERVNRRKPQLNAIPNLQQVVASPAMRRLKTSSAVRICWNAANR